MFFMMMPTTSASAAPSSDLYLHTIDELLVLPPTPWLIKDVIQAGSFTVLFGPPGAFKSFVALDMALHVAADQRWCGHDVKGGPVVYVMAEGRGSIQVRIGAAIQDRPLLRTPDLLVALEPVSLMGLDHVGTLLSKVEGRDKVPSLIVIDTLARCFVGGDENSAQDMGRLVQAIACLQRNTGAAVLLIHHCGKPNETYRNKPPERGSSALRGAAECMIRVERTKTDRAIVLVNDKMRDAAEFPPLALWMNLVTVVDVVDASGQPVTSCVVSNVADDADVLPEAALGVRLQTALTVLGRFPNGVASATAWRIAIDQHLGRSVPDRTFQNWRGGLLAAGAIQPVPDRAHHYRVANAQPVIDVSVN
jgi:hypothetical protein